MAVWLGEARGGTAQRVQMTSQPGAAVTVNEQGEPRT